MSSLSGWINTDVFTAARMKLLAAIAGAGTLIRGVGGFSLVEIAELVGEGLMVALAVAMSEGWIGSALSEAATWTLYGVVLYLFLPGFGPRKLTVLFEDRLLRLLVTLAVIVFAVPLVLVFGVAEQRAAGFVVNPLGPSFPRSLLFAYLVFTLTTWLYLRFGPRKPVHEDDDITWLIDQTGPATRGMFGDRFERLLMEVAVAMLLALVVLQLSAVVAILSALYPLPELAFVAGGIVAIGKSRLNRDPVPGLSASSFDIEGRLGEGIGKTFGGLQGSDVADSIFLSSLVGLGMFIFGVAGLGIGRERLGMDGSDIVVGGTPAVLEPFARVAVLGASITVIAATLCLFWALVRISKRSSAYLTAHERSLEGVPGTEVRPSTSRPVDGIFVPLAVSAVAVFVIAPDWQGAVRMDRSPLVAAYGLVWPLGLATLALWVRDTLRRKPQPALADRWLYPTLTVLSAAWFVATAASFSNRRVVLSFALVGLLVIVLSSFQRLNRWRRQNGKPWHALPQVGLLLAPVAAFGVVWPSFAPVLFGAGVLCGLLAVLMMIADKRRRAREDRSVPDTLVEAYRREIEGVDGPVRVLIPSAEVPDTCEETVHRAFAHIAERWQSIGKHPNIVEVHRVGDQPRPWLAVEPVGESLAEGRGLRSSGALRAVVLDVLRGVETAHDQGIVHGDINPAHVRLRDTEDSVGAAVGDWGLERACRLAAGEPHETPYTAPELRDEDELDYRMDIYGVGALIYEALAGYPPDKSSEDPVSDVPLKQLTDASAVHSDDIDGVVRAALAAQPAERYQSAAAFRRALSDVLDSSDDFKLTAQTFGESEATFEAEMTGEASSAGPGESTGATARIPDRMTRREAVAGAGICAFGAIGYTFPHLGGTDNPLLPDAVQYAFHSREGTPQWSLALANRSRIIPVVSSGILYTACQDGNVYAVETSGGTEQWVFNPDTDRIGRSVAADGETIAAVVGDTLYVLNAAGEQRWHWDIDPTAFASTVSVNDGTVYVTMDFDDVTDVHAFDVVDGVELWHNRTIGSGVGNPLLADGNVHVTSGGALFAFDHSDGSTVWTSDREIRPIERWSPTPGPGSIYVLGQNQERRDILAALDPADGTALWATETSTDAQTIGATGEAVYIADDQHVRAVAASDGTDQWRVELEGIQRGAAVGDTAVYVFDELSPETGIVRALDQTTGTALWSLELTGTVDAMRAGYGHLYLVRPTDNGGLLYAIATRD